MHTHACTHTHTHTLSLKWCNPGMCWCIITNTNKKNVLERFYTSPHLLKISTARYMKKKQCSETGQQKYRFIVWQMEWTPVFSLNLTCGAWSARAWWQSDEQKHVCQCFGLLLGLNLSWNWEKWQPEQTRKITKKKKQFKQKLTKSPQWIKWMNE